MTVLNPATEEPIAELEQAGVDEMDAAVARAKTAFPAWSAVATADRARLLRRLATLVEEMRRSSRASTRRTSASRSRARGEIGWSCRSFRARCGPSRRARWMHALARYSEIKSVFISTEG